MKMEKLEEIGVDEMLGHLRGLPRRSRESFFQQVLREEACDIDAGTVRLMQNRLHEACRQSADNSLFQQFVRRLRDPIRPTTKSGAWRPHPLLLVWGGASLLALGTFLYWSFFR